MIASADLTSFVSGSDEEQAVQYILMIDQAYKKLEKTPRLKLLVENDPEVETFGRLAMQSLTSQKTLSEFLSGNNTLYGGPQDRCGLETFTAMEAVLFKGSVYHFMGQQIVEQKEPSQDQIDQLKVMKLEEKYK